MPDSALPVREIVAEVFRLADVGDLTAALALLDQTIEEARSLEHPSVAALSRHAVVLGRQADQMDFVRKHLEQALSDTEDTVLDDLGLTGTREERMQALRQRFLSR